MEDLSRKLDSQTRAALDNGTAIPTIQSALSDEVMLGYFREHIQTMADADKAFLRNALQAVEKEVGMKGVPRLAVESLVAKIGITTSGLAGVFGVLVAWACESDPTVGIATGGLAVTLLPSLGELKDERKTRSRFDQLIAALRNPNT